MNEGLLIPLSPNGDDATDLVPRLKPTVNKIKKLCRSQRTRTFKAIFDVGLALVEGWETTRDDAPFFGDQQAFFEYVQKATGLDRRDLSDCERLVAMYNREAFDDLVKHPHVTWTHIRQLLRIPSESVRSELERQLIEEKWSSRELTAAVIKLQPPTTPTHGRLPSVPRDPGHCLRQITAAADRLLGQFESVWFGERFDLRTKIADLPAEKLDEQVALQIAQAEQLLGEVGREAQRCSESLAPLKQLVNERLAESQSKEEKR